MHSSRMRTVRYSGVVCRGGGCLPRGCLHRGVSAWGGVCSGQGVCPGGVNLGAVCLGDRSVCLGSVCPGGVYTPGPKADTSPRGQTDIYKNITFPQLLLRTVNINVEYINFFLELRWGCPRYVSTVWNLIA